MTTPSIATHEEWVAARLHLLEAGRGIDMLNGAYNYLDLVPKGRDEDGLGFPMEWVRRHDQY